LLEQGYSVFLPVVDTGIDCLVDGGRGNYKEIQIKHREDQAMFHVRNFEPRNNYYVICILSTRREDNIWVIPSGVFGKLGHRNKDGAVTLAVGKPGSESYDALQQYRENYHQLLKGASDEVKKAVRQASRKVEGEHFKQRDFAPLILQVLSQQKGPLERKEIVRKLAEQVQGKFSKADLEKLGSRARWEKTARFAISDMALDGAIEAKSKNQWVITDKGREKLAHSATSL
jgi:hypothetical protein